MSAAGQVSAKDDAGSSYGVLCRGAIWYVLLVVFTTKTVPISADCRQYTPSVGAAAYIYPNSTRKIAGKLTIQRPLSSQMLESGTLVLPCCPALTLGTSWKYATECCDTPCSSEPKK